MEQEMKYKSVDGGIKRVAIILFVIIALIGSVEAATYTPGQVMNTVSKYMTPQNAINPTNPMQMNRQML